MNHSDEDLKRFFAEMRNADHQVDVPNVDDLKKPQPQKRRYWLPLGIAASLLIIASTYLFYQHQNEQAESLELIITLGTPAEMNTQQLINRESSIDTWESPTRSLIDDF